MPHRLNQQHDGHGDQSRVNEADEATVAESAVEQILFNLVDNACKYAARAEKKSVELDARLAGRRLRLRVRDHGPGLSAKQRRRLFQPFRKSADEAAGTAPGVGLGLALSRRLARDMGGDLQLDEMAAGGAAFVLSLPVA